MRWLLAYTPSAISPVLSLAIYSAQHHNKLDSFEASRIYAAISLIGLITSPLNAVFQQVPPLVTVVRCFERLQKFLELDRHTDYRAPLLQDSAIKEKGTERLIIEAAHNDSESPKEESHILRIQDASFAYHGATSHVLNGVSICIPRSKVTAIIGPVGCGKSAFLKSLLGEMKLIKGKVSMGFGLSSYCDQSPWIQNGTIQENILGCTGEIDMEWYRRVLWACELEHDLSLFPEHDQSNVGSDGVALSGGQKQRIVRRAVMFSSYG